MIEARVVCASVGVIARRAVSAVSVRTRIAVRAVDPEEQEQVLDVDLACAHATASRVAEQQLARAWWRVRLGRAAACAISPAWRALAGSDTAILTENDRDASKTAACVSPKKEPPMAAGGGAEWRCRRMAVS